MPALTESDGDRSGGDKPRPYRMKENSEGLDFLEKGTKRRRDP